MARYERKDHFHQRAKREGYRSRAAYKLLEIQRAEGLLRAGDHVVDVGCWPGGWLQVAAAAVGDAGRVVGVDRDAIDPPLDLPNVTALAGDITDAEVVQQVRDALGRAADVVLSDAAPKLTGVRAVDRAAEEALLEAVVGCLPALLRERGSLLLKVLDGPEALAVVKRARGCFEKSKTVKAAASRKGTSERYLVARGYRAPA